MRRIVHTEEALRELAATAAWYDEHGAIGGDVFISAIDAEIEQIRDMPFASPAWSYAPRYRARTLRKLRYRIIYEVTDGEIRIVAIAHTSRDPRFWLDRVK